MAAPARVEGAAPEKACMMAPCTSNGTIYRTEFSQSGHTWDVWLCGEHALSLIQAEILVRELITSGRRSGDGKRVVGNPVRVNVLACDPGTPWRYLETEEA